MAILSSGALHRRHHSYLFFDALLYRSGLIRVPRWLPTSYIHCMCMTCTNEKKGRSMCVISLVMMDLFRSQCHPQHQLHNDDTIHVVHKSTQKIHCQICFHSFLLDQGQVHFSFHPVSILACI